jgi:hypothetical protein
MLVTGAISFPYLQFLDPSLAPWLPWMKNVSQAVSQTALIPVLVALNTPWTHWRGYALKHNSGFWGHCLSTLCTELFAITNQQAPDGPAPISTQASWEPIPWQPNRRPVIGTNTVPQLHKGLPWLVSVSWLVQTHEGSVSDWCRHACQLPGPFLAVKTDC